jgi:hypothetical protein
MILKEYVVFTNGGDLRVGVNREVDAPEQFNLILSSGVNPTESHLHLEYLDKSDITDLISALQFALKDALKKK